MFLRELSVSIDHIKGAGPAAIKTLARTGITSVSGLLCYYPRDWEDRSVTVPLRDFQHYPAVCTVVRVLAHDWFGFGRMRTLKVHVEDDTAKATLVCFNRPFLEKQLTVGAYFRLWGRFYYKYGEIQSTAFEVEPYKVNAPSINKPLDNGPSVNEPSVREPSVRGFGHILPIYPLTAGLTQGLLRKLVKHALAQYAAPLQDELPQAVIDRDGLLSKAEAIRAIHFPASMPELTAARKTLIYEELFYLEVMVGKRALERRGLVSGQESKTLNNNDSDKALISNRQPKSEASGAGRLTPSSVSVHQPDPEALSPLQQHLLERLPFSLTPGQLSATADINRDMAAINGTAHVPMAHVPMAHVPMARLLQGDVGSGKTLVSFLAALRAVEEPAPGGIRGQAAIMAPTEFLARQHAENAAALLEPLGIRPAFLTGNIRAAGRNPLLKALAAGDIDIVVGTHALFSKDVAYRNLRLVVVDEQHRFGVTQRQAIMAKGDHPDLLMMSATPIPRTLALTVFGDLDVSVIPDLPPGRKPITTHLAKESNEDKVYGFVKKELAAGRQAYFVYPLIGGGDSDGTDTARRGSGSLKDAESMAERLARQVFPQYPVALVHSKLDEEDKRQTMDAFRRGEVKVLVATSVVEVGVDVPNATCMVIEHAERFGLSALHQLRGRVGRGAQQSYCFLVYSDPEGPTGEKMEDWQTRLKVMLETGDGFVIAEEDLKLRGPGQIAGIEQSGYLSLGIADPIRDAADLARARTDAFAMLEADPGLLQPEHRRVAEVLERASPFSQVVL
ncbi:ATP-dependent DNA helicase RecG [Spirochaetia bacterium]|nr:ATP-dependent DNA helicase RecG [Spirochaetia bacterium]